MAELAKTSGTSIRGDTGVPRGSALFGWDPFRLLNTMGQWGTSFSRTEDGYDIETPVPGFGPKDIELSYHDGVLQVQGKNDRRTMTQSLWFPDDADPEKIDARVENGLLTIHVERYEQSKPRKITVKGA